MLKDDSKRQAILDTAYQLFQTRGFEATSVSEISTAVGASKSTLYNHFASKEALFVECMAVAATDYIARSLAPLHAAGTDPGAALRSFGIRFLNFSTSTHALAMQRLLIAEAHRSGIGKLFFDRTDAVRAHVARFLARLMATGALRNDDAQQAANHLRGLLEAELIEPLLLCVRADPPAEDEITLAADRAVTAFLRAYAPPDWPHTQQPNTVRSSSNRSRS